MKDIYRTGTPVVLKKISSLIRHRFCINGLCDAMYICNVLAYEFGMGDGESHFTSDAIPENANYEKAAKYLQNAYGCNIAKSEISELSDIIRTGKIDLDLAIDGLGRFLKERKQEIAKCDEWRKDYLKKVIAETKENINYFTMKEKVENGKLGHSKM